MGVSMCECKIALLVTKMMHDISAHVFPCKRNVKT